MTQEEKQAQLLSAWLEGGEAKTPEGLDDDVVEAIGALRPDLAAPPDIDIDGLFDEVMGTSTSAPESEGAEVVPKPANTNRWWMLGGTGLVVAATALIAVSVVLNAPKGSLDASMADQTPASAPSVADNTAVGGDEAEVEEAEIAEAGEPRKKTADRRQLADGDTAVPPEAVVASADGSPEPEEPAPPAEAAARPRSASGGSSMARPAPITGKTTTTASTGAQAPNLIVQGVLADRRTAIAACYNEAAGRDPMTSGAVVVEWAVMDGRTAFAEAVRDSTGDEGLKRCIVDIIRKLQWPDGADGEWTERWAFSSAGDAMKRSTKPMMDDVMLEASESAE